MSAPDALDTLADRYGIEPEFIDATGKLQRTAAQTKRALLAALGVAADGDTAARAALDARESDDWRAALPPVVVATAADLRVPVVLPPGSGEFTWRLKLEGGAQRSETVVFSALPALVDSNAGAPPLEKRELRLPAVADGYHSLTIDNVEGATSVIVTPGRCWLPPSIEAGERLGGIALQLYLLRSNGNWGFGDFSDLRAFVTLVAARGLDVVGLNPLHEMFVDDPEHASPYSPASRLLLNVLNIDVTAIAEFAGADAARARVGEADFAARLQACRDAARVDYTGVATLKLDVLRLVFGAFSAGASAARRDDFARFQAESSPNMRRTHLFIALREHFAAQDPPRAAWLDWPAEFHDPQSPAVAQFASDHGGELAFIAWLQWIADAQLAAAADAARPMRVGLYRDLAVGADPAGAETWTNAHAVVATASVGAPPDIYNPAGQNWGLPPFHPQGLRDEAYRSFIELVRANMRHAGGLRIDHVMALQHLYWIPQGAAPSGGAYVRYPLDDLVGILALESHRARCLVVGEDLGTVPAGFRERMAAANILSYRVLFFEREADEPAAFIAPVAYPSLALAVLGSHDLPTLGAWWNGADIRLRQRLGLVGDLAAAGEQRQQRARDREAFIGALESAGVLDLDRPLDRHTLFTSAHAFLAATAATLAVAQIDDVTDETEPVNVPTTSDEHPNWRRRLSASIEELPDDPRFEALFSVLRVAGRLRD